MFSNKNAQGNQIFSAHRTSQVNLACMALLCSALAACGGGGGGGAESTGQAPAPVVPVTPTANEFKTAYDGGIYLLSGYGIMINGVTQPVIGKETLDTINRVQLSVNTYGNVSTFETLPTLFPQVAQYQGYYTSTGTVAALLPQLTFGTDSTTADVTPDTTDTTMAAAMKWKATLQTRDVSGTLVSDSLRYAKGDLVTGRTFANPAATFPAGSKAYTTSLTASTDMYIQFNRMLATNETELFTTYNCMTIPGVDARLIIEPVSGGIIRYSETTTGNCSRVGEVKLTETGSWAKSKLNNDNLYTLTHSTAIKNGKWAPLFAAPISPSDLPINVMYERPAASGLFYSGYLVRAGETFVSKQPHFNAAALSGLRALSGI